MVTKSDNTKGNPYHDKEGKFTKKEGASAGGGINTENESVGSLKKLSLSDIVITPQEVGKLNLFNSEDDDADFWDKVDAYSEAKTDSAEEDLKTTEGTDQVTISTNPDVVTVINGLDSKTVYDTLLKDPTLDPDKIKNASESELKELLQAQSVLAEKKNDKTLEEANNKYFYNLWQYPVKPSDYLDKKDKIQTKKDYFLFDYKGSDKQEKLASLDSFVESGEKYAKAKEIYDSKYKSAIEIVDKFGNGIYSFERKESAIYIGSKNYPVIDKIAESKKVFGPNSKTVITSLQNSNPTALAAVIGYTSSYSSINEPLRGETYLGSKTSKEEFIKNVEGMTDAIELSTYDFDYWVQRGTHGVVDEENEVDINPSMTTAELNSLVGKQFVQRSFFSAGAAKNTGMPNRPIILNVYCPKGTKGLYVESISHYAGENEMILQRGYTYKITDVEKDSDGKIFVGCEVVLGSDKDKYTHEQLVDVANKYIME